ncbi:PHP-associated domain-containing protein [Spirochaeta thermophila]|uniref:Polymerase/histidinol phosphatase N-terminal domain-containing protein n=1 Tax=Winmispira thermophila (strain ATCC 49972 / DSM 6192 / RI 19.B1) TaxID=665571 RepID=E0RQ51_WINT6|nr:PHP-associated domain-containing protein [Spirochaeta thermophila]ADN01435.1 hypothetical protein STHERM_c04630 [Spirochaeta thermophila DSM 6192]
MKRIDLHVHSIHSEHPSEWFMQRLGAKESYTDPETVFRMALERGMDFVTITDHNRIEGALLLKARYPDRVIVGVETTTYFPEDGCKIHLLLYGLDEHRFRMVEKLRPNIYRLRDYIREEGIAHSVAHATYPVNNRLTVAHLEKLILLFDVFEVINGGRNSYFNNAWKEVLLSLTPAHIERLQRKHHIAPFSSTPWVKGFTAGSDDHGGLFIGNTYTLVEAHTPEEVLDHIREKRTQAAGAHGSYRSLVFSVYKVAYDFLTSGGGGGGRSLFLSLSRQIFEGARPSLRERALYSHLRRKLRGQKMGEILDELVRDISGKETALSEARLERVFLHVRRVSDAFLRMLAGRVAGALLDGDLVDLLVGLSSSLPGLYLIAPFFSSLRHMYAHRDLVEGIRSSLGIQNSPSAASRVLWFSEDGRPDPSVIRILAPRAHVLPVTPSASLPGTSLPIVAEIPLDPGFSLPLPSPLGAAELLSREQPDHLVFTAADPVALVCLFLGRLIGASTTFVFDPRGEGHPVAHTLTTHLLRHTERIVVHTEEAAARAEGEGADPAKIHLAPPAAEPVGV